MALIEAPDIAGLLDAMGRHDAADTVRWTDKRNLLAELREEVEGLRGALGEAERERGYQADECDRLRDVIAEIQKENAIPFVNPDLPPELTVGFVAGRCGHRVARSEWNVGIRDCERCAA